MATPETARTPSSGGAAIFDLDGTVIDCSSERRFLLYLFRTGLIGWRDLLRWSTVAVGRLHKGTKFAMRANRSYLRGHGERALAEAARDFYEVELKARVAESALVCAAEHEARGDAIVLLSGSLTVLAEPFRSLLNAAAVVASDLASVEGRMTGALSNLHPVSVGKVAHARVLAGTRGFSLNETSAYADSGSDIPLLEQVGAPFAVNPDSALERHARAHGWEILDWHGV